MATPPSVPPHGQNDPEHAALIGERSALDESRGSHRNGNRNVTRLARGLGWLSLGLGAAQLVAPGKVARLTGVAGHRHDQKLMRLVGLREVTSGLGILIQAKPTSWLWSRVGGDAIDLALLGSALRSPRSNRPRVVAATVAVLGLTAADALASARMAAEPDAPTPDADIHAKAAVTINAPVAEVYQFWDGFRQLPRFMRDTASVQTTGDGRSHWTLSAPAGITLSWDVEITDSRPNEAIAWRAAGDSPVEASGEVRFRPAPGGRGTEVVFDARFRPPGGELGKTVGGILAGVLGTQIGNDLRRCKQLIELGEIVQSDDSLTPGPNPAQPPASVPAGVTVPASAAGADHRLASP